MTEQTKLSRVGIALAAISFFPGIGMTEMPTQDATSLHVQWSPAMIHSDSATSHLAAHAALLALRASLPEPAHVDADRVILLPHREVLTNSEAAGLLARMAKPLQCSAHAEDGALAVNCQKLAPENMWLHEAAIQGINEGRGLIGSVGHQALRYAAADEARVLLTGRDESLLVPPAVMEEWERDYVIMSEISLSGGPPNADEHGRGALWAVHVGRVHPISWKDIEILPEPDRSALQKTFEEFSKKSGSNPPS